MSLTEITIDNAGVPFEISSVPQMPDISAHVRVVGINPDPTASTSFQWQTLIKLNASDCAHGRDVTYSPPTQTTVGGDFTPSFAAIRGGKLVFTVTASVNGCQLKGMSDPIKIIGRNPPKADIQGFPGVDATLSKIFCQESGQTQFLGDCPYWSEDNRFGAGIGQITPATDDNVVWNWRANVQAGVNKYNQSHAAANGFPGRIQNSMSLRDLLAAYNMQRAQMGLQPLVRVNVPAFTATQVQHDTIRGYNGFAPINGDPDFPGFELHEYRIVRDSTGLLHVENINETTLTGDLTWEEVPVAARQGFGDPNYVQHVLGQSATCP